MKVNILSVPVDAVRFTEAIDTILQLARDGQPHHVITMNPEMVVEAQRNSTFLDAIKAADLVVPDGVGLLPTAHFLHSTKPANGIVLFLKEWLLILETLLGRSRFDILKETVSGIDLTQALCEKAKEKGIPVVFIGGYNDEAALAAKAVQEKVAGLQISSDPGPNDVSGETADEYQRILSLLRQHPNGFYFVAFGHPKQELWIAKHKADLPAGVFMGVGGTFTYLSGKRRRAHSWLRKLGLEWLWRLAAEPARWKRIVTAFIVYPHLVYKGKCARSVGC